MRNLKRALSLALASVMLVGMMVVGASAASYPDVDAGKHDIEAIDVLEAIGVMKGDAGTGNFRPDDKVSRNEMAVVMARLILGNYAADSYVGTHPFTDVPSWADRYVAACYSSGIINGTSATTYSGTKNVTAVQAAAMMLRALGYEDLSKGATKWDIPVAAKANEINLFEDMNGSGTAQLTRNEIAKLSLNALKSDVVNTIKGTDINIPGTVEIVGARSYERVVRGSNNTENNNYATSGATGNATGTEVGVGYQQLCEKLYGNDLRLRGSNEDDLGRPASTWRYKGEDIVKVADEADYTFVLDDDYTGDALLDTLKDLTNDDDLTVSSTRYVVNGVDDDGSALDDTDVQAVATYGTVVEVYVDDHAIEHVIAYYYTLDKITDVDTDVKDADAKKGVSAYVDFDNASTINDNKIANFNADTYEKDTYVAIIQKGEEIIDSFIPEVEEDSVSTVKASEYITAGGTKYYPTASYGSSVETITLNTTNVSTKSDDSYAIYLDKNGYMLGLKEIEGSVASLDEVYYVDNIYQGQSTTVAGTVRTPEFAQLVALADGTISQVELEKEDIATKAGVAASYHTNKANYEGKLVTISDKDWTNNSGDKFKKNNDKFDLELWTNSVNDDYDVYTEVKFTENDELKTDSTRVAVNAKENGAGAAAKTIRLNSSTKYIFAESTMEDLDVKTATGGVAYKFDKNNLVGAAGTYATYNKAIVVTEADKAYALYIIIPCVDSEQNNTFSEDVIYIHEVSTAAGDGFIEQEVYLADGSKETWKIDDGESMTDDTFYTYDTNEDGFIELGDADVLDDTANVWGDRSDSAKVGAVVNASVAKGALTDDGLLTVTFTNLIEDIKVIGTPKFVDLHDKDTEYGSSITSLNRLMDLMDNDRVLSATISMNVSEDGVSTIFLLAAVNCAHGGTFASVDDTNHTCNDCGAVLPHSYGDAADVDAANHKYTCSDCAYEKTEAHGAKSDWVTTDGTNHWNECTATGCTRHLNEAAHQTAAEAEAAGKSVTHMDGNDGSDDTHTWTCTCGKEMSEACPGTSSTACPACGYNKDTGKA